MTKTSELMDAHALRTRLGRLQRTLEATRLLSGILQPEELLRALVRAAAELTDSEQGAVARPEGSSGQLALAWAPWLPLERMQAIELGEDSPIQQAFRTLWPALGEQLPTLEARNLLAVPMVVDGSPQGVLCAVNKRSGEFDREDILVMETLAAHAAVCIENAEMMQQARQGYSTLAELDKMRNDFIAITSHELRIPLGLVLGHASYLNELLDGEAKEQSQTIEKAALRLKDIVEDLSKIELAQSGTSVVRAARYDIAEQLHRLIVAHQPAASGRSVRLNSQIPGHGVFVVADANKLFVAIDHLLKNAIAFTDSGGLVQVSLKEDGDEVVVEVADSGIGIPAADLPRVFDRFYQVEDHMTRRHGGMGLGLTIARTLVEMHGGSLQAESVEGKGSRFSLRMPRLGWAGHLD